MSSRTLWMAITVLVMCACEFWFDDPRLAIVVLLAGVSVTAGHGKRRMGR